MKVYLDNAATTPMAKEVIDAIIPLMQNNFGNPSSTHSFGREVRGIVETARRKIGSFLNVTPGELIFTSGGTEADNMALLCSVEDLGVTHIITSPMEHHAVLHTVEHLQATNQIKLSMVKVKPDGHIDLEDLERLIGDGKNTLVSLMHANNEIGNMLPLEKVGNLCHSKGAYFHSDTVQTIAHYAFDLDALPIDFVTCSAHKFHGPKGIGFLYVSKKLKINAMIHGGSQERGKRGGTENIIGIVGLAKAMTEALLNVEEHQNHVQGLKTYMINELEKNITGIQFNGDAKGDSLYTVLNVCFPEHPKGSMLLLHLDLLGIAVSGGSACSSGSNKGSHVLESINSAPKRPAVRFSFSRLTTKEEIDYALNQLYKILN